MWEGPEEYTADDGEGHETAWGVSPRGRGVSCESLCGVQASRRKSSSKRAGSGGSRVGEKGLDGSGGNNGDAKRTAEEVDSSYGLFSLSYGRVNESSVQASLLNSAV